MRIALHADGGSQVGLGHLGRCVALAQAFRAAGGDPRFVDVPPDCRPWLLERDFKSASLASSHWDLVVGDSYRLNAIGWRRLRSAGRRLLVIDDLGGFSQRCDFILNGHVDAPTLKFDRAQGASLLLGPKFFPMRSEYWKLQRTKAQPNRLRRVLVTLGAGKTGGIAERAAAEAASALPHARVELIAAPLSPLQSPSRGVTVVPPQPSLRPLFESADLVVCAGGQTLYEAAFCGAPAIAVQLAANQQGNISGMAHAGAAISAGLPGDRMFWTAFRSLVRALDKTPRRRNEMARAGRSVVDGQGALRVAASVLR